MPIHFRCPHCRQLMGIARRKAGAVIHCPTCTKEMVVPRRGEGPAAEDRQAVEHRPNSLLEKIDVDAILNPPPTGRAVSAVNRERSAGDSLSLASPSPPPLPAAADGKVRASPPRPEAGKNAKRIDAGLPSLSLEPRRRGIFLSPAKITVASVAGVLLLGLAFVLGLIVGRSM